MPARLQTIILLLIITLSYPFFGAKVALAQETIPWSEPENLSNTPTKSHHQFIVADQYGEVHVFWVEDVGGPEVGPEEEGNPGNTIFYRRWDGQSWSFPVDIFFSRGLTYSYPTAAVDDNGILYLIWVTFNGLHFSSVPANLADSAMNWENDSVLANVQGASRAALLARGNGQLDVLYDSATQVGDFSKNGNIYYIRSTDGGLSWSSPVQLTDIDPRSDTLAVFPRLARDQKDRLHAVWYNAEPPDFIGSSVYYSRSLDNGETWSIPLKVDEATAEKKWATTINIGAIGEDEIHLVWVCGVLPGRCHQYSRDGGETWTAPRPVFGDLVSRANWDALATDAKGNLYWVLQLRSPQALYYSYWTGESWIDPPLVVHSRDPFVSEGHGVQMTIRNGNELHLVVHHPEAFEIWHLWGESPLAAPVAPKPTPTPLVISKPEITAAPIDSDTAPASLPASMRTEAVSPARPDFSMLVGIIVAIVVIGVVAAYRVAGRKR